MGWSKGKPRAGFWFAEPSAQKIPRFSFWPPLLTTGGVALAILIALKFEKTIDLQAAIALGSTFLVLSILVNRWGFQRDTRRFLKALPSDALFADREYDADEYPTVISVLVDGVAIGTDRGIVRIADGLLSFHGAATSFALAAGDFVLWGRFAAHDPYAGLPDDALRLRVSGMNVAVRLLGLASHDQALKQKVSTFLHRGETTSEPRQWPPVQPFEEQDEAEDSPLPCVKDRSLEADALMERAHLALEAGHFDRYAELQEAALRRS